MKILVFCLLDNKPLNFVEKISISDELGLISSRQLNDTVADELNQELHKVNFNALQSLKTLKAIFDQKQLDKIIAKKFDSNCFYHIEKLKELGFQINNNQLNLAASKQLETLNCLAVEECVKLGDKMDLKQIDLILPDLEE